MYRVVLILLILVLNLKAQSCALNSNLIKGGTFESESDLSYWQRVAGTGYIKRASYLTGWAGSAPSGAGSYFLYATRGSELYVVQTIDLKECMSNGGDFYELKGYHGGYGDGDSINFTIEFLDENNNILSRYTTGDFTSNRSMEEFSNSSKLSSSVVKAIITLTFKRRTGTDIDGYLDNLSLVIKDEYDDNAVETIYKEGFQNFDIINPLTSRLIRGNFAIAGNTVMCLTEKSNGYGGTCQDSAALYKTSNLRVSKYIDIDDKSSTFNSTSSYIELPSSYENRDDGKSIVWAGLFWQGRISIAKSYYLRYGKESLFGHTYVETGRGTSINTIEIDKTGVNKILLKVNDNNYEDVVANKIYYAWKTYSYYGGKGITYAAYADVTKVLQDAKLKKGKNNFTIANLVTSEGREGTPGIFGGWSLVVIYKEDLSGKVRSISSYFGFRDIYYSDPIEIKGLKLPRSGKVSSKAALFSGEGEYLYGKNRYSYRSYDWIKISNNIAYNYEYMPDANGNPLPSDTSVGNRDNIFDAHLSGVKREHIDGKYNDLEVNNNGVDVDIFDLSNIMEGYRDDNPKLDTIYLKMSSNNDYVTPSMITFATELYAPKICYDYDVKLGEYINIPTDDRNFSVDGIGDEPLQIKAMIRSQESDFDLIDTTLSATFTPNDVFEYKQGSSKYSPPNTMIFLPAVETNSSLGEIAIGNSVSSSGGVIGANERTYAKLYYNFKKGSFDGRLDLTVNAKISFDGVNKVPYTLSTTAPKDSIFYLKRCPTNKTYDPIYGMINVERGDSTFSQREAQRYSLYTQVVGVPYEISVAGYQKDRNGEYKEPKRLVGAFEVELIDALTFDNNSTSGYDSICQDPEYGGGAFVDFMFETRKKLRVPDDFPNYPINSAYKSAVFRTWILRAPGDGNEDKVAIYPPEPLKRLGDVYFKLLYDINKFKELEPNGVCDSACRYSINDANIIRNHSNNPKDYKCYQCLRSYYSAPICSRDNFAIRPYSYSIAISDINQTKDNKNTLNIGYNNNSVDKHLAAGYVYKLDINATSYNSRDNVYRYTFKNLEGDISKKRAVATFRLTQNGFSCVDKSDHNLNISMYGGKIQDIGEIDLSGSSITKNAFIVNNVGKYLLHLEDLEWTEVDQKGSPYKPFPEVADCDINSTIANVTSNIKKGCLISTSINSVDTLPDMAITLHPYRFDLSDIRVENSLNSASNFVYISNLRSTTSQLPNSVMALNILGDIEAKGKNGKIVTNYKDGCMANDTNINIKYKINQNNGIVKSAVLQDIVPMQHYIYESRVDTTNLVKVEKILTNNKSDLNTTFSKKYFYLNGVAKYKSFINFKREFNEPINPFKVTIKEFEFKSIKDKMVADLNTTYYPKVKKDLNTTKIFYYAKSKAKNSVYDDIYDDNITTPLGIAVYCNRSLEYCLDHKIDTIKGLTNEYDWWWSREHNGSSLGSILIKLDSSKDSAINSKIEASTLVVNDFVYGLDNSLNISIKDRDNIAYPYKVDIVYSDNMKYIFPYLMYNPHNNSAPKLLESIRFVYKNDKWSGGGNTGYVTDYNSTGRRTNKIEW